MKATTTKEMAAAPARRIARLATRIEVPLPANHARREALENAAHTCPVHKSLLAEIECPVEFVWTG